METRKRTPESTTKKVVKVVGGGAIAAAGFAWSVSGSNGPSNPELSHDQSKAVEIVATPGDVANNSHQLVASSIDGAINKVDPDVDEATQYALQQYVIQKENNGSSTAVNGEVFHIPEVNNPKK